LLLQIIDIFFVEVVVAADVGVIVASGLTVVVLLAALLPVQPAALV
jgi:hypothetical protein